MLCILYEHVLDSPYGIFEIITGPLNAFDIRFLTGWHAECSFVFPSRGALVTSCSLLNSTTPGRHTVMLRVWSSWSVTGTSVQVAVSVLLMSSRRDMKARQLLLVFLPGLERYALKYLKIFLVSSLKILTTILRCLLSLGKNNYKRSRG